MASLEQLGLRHIYSGKVRDLYEVGSDHLLMVASDRMSAFDVIMREPVPQKGRVLTAMTNYWVREFAESVPAALVTCDPLEIDQFVSGFAGSREWHGRSMLARRATMMPLECIVRGRLAGQAFDEYREHATVHGAPAPAGMELTDEFAEARFTPSTKAESGHDVNIDLASAARIVGAQNLERAQRLCLGLFNRAREKMETVGLILADTKFEVGFVDDEMVLCDEVLTPDSSRIWPADQVRRGETPPSFDKQPFRDWLSAQAWNRTPPAPEVPEDVLVTTSRRYVEAYERVTGRSHDDWYGA